MRAIAYLFALAALSMPCMAQTTIVGWESYFDVDQGPDSGTWHALVPNDTVNLIDQVDGTGLSSGYHKLFIRFKTTAGLWSAPEVRTVYVQPDGLSAMMSEVVACEYYVGETDVEPGTGTPLPLDSVASSVYIQRQLDLLSLGLPNGDYHINIRFKSSGGFWSMVERRTFTVCETYGALADFDVYRSGSAVSFVDQSQYATSIFYDFGDGQTDTVWNPYHVYGEPGNYTVTQTATNSCAVSTAQQVAHLTGINGYFPHQGGSGGVCTITLSGVNFTQDMTFRLFRTGFPDIVPDTLFLHSSTSASFLMNLLDQDQEFWSMELVIPGDTTLTITDGFLIVPGSGNMAMKTEVIGPARLRYARWGTYTIRVHNPNPNDAFAVPLWFAYSNDLLVQYEAEIESLAFAPLDTMTTSFQVDSLFGKPFVGTIYPLLIGRIPAGSSIDLVVRVKSPNVSSTAKIYAWADLPLLGLNGEIDNFATNSDRDLAAFGRAYDCYGCLLDLLPGVSCISDFVKFNIKSFSDAADGKKAKFSEYLPYLKSMVWDCGTLALQIAFPETWIASTLEKLGKLEDLQCLTSILTSSGCADDLPVPPAPVDIGCACDPNEKSGPFGRTPARYVQGDDAVTYTIAFENADTSLFSAQRVVIIDTLDMDLFALNQATLGYIGLADSVFAIAPQSRSTALTAELSQGNELRLNADIDTTKGIVRWDLFIADTTTHELPADQDVGFLPPNINSPEGQGYVTVRIPMRPGLPHEQVIGNRAVILFDDNPAITTATWSNTVDRVAPTSHMLPLPSFSSDTSVLVSWSGSDLGSGVFRYEVYASADTSVGYELWRITGDTTGVFEGADATTYHFYSVAIDSVGNRELKMDTSEAHTQIDFNTVVAPLGDNDVALGLYPNPTAGSITLRGHTVSGCTLHLVVRNAVGQVMLIRSFPTSPGLIRSSVDLSGLAQGAYIATVTCNEAKLVERLVRLGE